MDIPELVESISDEAFAGCNSMEEVYVRWGTPIEIKPTVFDLGKGGKYDMTLYVPIGMKEVYASAPVWQDFREIKEFDYLVVGINNPIAVQTKTTTTIHNLSGIAVGSDSKGIVIINGKKYLNK